MKRHSTWVSALLISAVCFFGWVQTNAAGQSSIAPQASAAPGASTALAAPGGDQPTQFSGRLGDLRPEVRSNLVKQLALLTGSDENDSDEFGYSVAISGDVVVVGSPYATVGGNSWQGEVYVFVKPAGGWANMTQTARLTASDGTADTRFGQSVAISGNTIVVGAAWPSSSEDAYVFVEPPTGWADMTETARLTGTAGLSVGISGNTIVAASWTGLDVFVEPPTGWADMTRTGHLTASDGSSLASSVAVSGNTVVAGAPLATVGSNQDQGAVYLFVKPRKGWADMTETAILTASDGAAGDGLGENSNALSISGSTVLVGSDYHAVNGNTYQGSAYLYVKPATGWTNMAETAEFTAADGDYDNFFGWSAFTNGSVAVVGAIGGGGGSVGAVYAYVKPAGGWATTSQAKAEMKGPGFATWLGDAVGMSGNVIVAGADNPSTNGDSYFPAVYVFGPAK